MKNVVLIYPKTGGEEFTKAPLPILAAASMIPDNYDVRILDCHYLDINDISNYVDPETILVGISSMTGYQIKNGLIIANIIKKRYPQIPIVWGGFHPSLLPEQTLKNKFVDIVVIGQGERTLSELVVAMDNGATLKDINGIGFKDGEKLFLNKPRNIENVENFPPIRYELIKSFIGKIKFDTWIYSPGMEIGHSINYVSSRGCPFNCSFCAINKVSGRRWVSYSSERVVNDLKKLVKNFGIKNIVFEDANFFVNEKWVNEICEGIIKNKLDIKWAAGGRARQINNFYDKTFSLLKKAGCVKILIGAESGSQKSLDFINKMENVEDNMIFVQICKKYGIIPVLSLMVGLPNETWDDIYKTLNFIKNSRRIYDLCEILLFFYTPYPGTELYSYALKSGFKEPENLESWGNHTLNTKSLMWLSENDTKKLEFIVETVIPALYPYNYYRFVTYPNLDIKKKIMRKLLENFMMIVLRFRLFWLYPVIGLMKRFYLLITSR